MFKSKNSVLINSETANWINIIDLNVYCLKVKLMFATSCVLGNTTSLAGATSSDLILK